MPFDVVQSLAHNTSASVILSFTFFGSFFNSPLDSRRRLQTGLPRERCLIQAKMFCYSSEREADRFDNSASNSLIDFINIPASSHRAYLARNPPMSLLGLMNGVGFIAKENFLIHHKKGSKTSRPGIATTVLNFTLSF